MQPLRAATECEVDLVRKRPDHGNGLRPWIPKQRPEFHLCATESQRWNLNPLTWTSPCEDWSLTSLKEKLIKIGAKVVSHGRYIAFQMAEVAIPRQMFQEIRSTRRLRYRASAWHDGTAIVRNYFRFLRSTESINSDRAERADNAALICPMSYSR